MVVCIADASSTFRRRVRNALRDADYEYAEVSNGSDLLEHLRNGPIDALVTTDDLGDRRGLETIRALRQSDSYTDLPVFYLTHAGTMEDVLQAVECGVTSYVVLPLQDEVLAAKVRAAEEAIKRRRTTKRRNGYTRVDVV